MNLPKLPINKINKDGEMSYSNKKIKLNNQEINNQPKINIDNSSIVMASNYNNFTKLQILPLKIKNNNISFLPSLVNKEDNRNINNYKNINNNYKVMNIKNNKIIRNKVKNLYNLYHPWLNNTHNNKEIHEFLSNCFDITKIDARINDNKSKINDSKLTNKLLRNVEKHYKISNLFKKKRLKKITFNHININNNNISIHDNTNIRTERRYNQNKLINNYQYKGLGNLNKENKNHSFDNTYFPLNKKSLRKNETNSNNEYILKDFLSSRDTPKISSSLNKSFSILNILNEDYNKTPQHKSIDINNNILKNEYKTIKIKKISKGSINGKSIEEKLNRIDKIKANLLFKKNTTYNSLFLYDENKNDSNKNNIMNNNLNIIYK